MMIPAPHPLQRRPSESPLGEEEPQAARRLSSPAALPPSSVDHATAADAQEQQSMVGRRTIARDNLFETTLPSSSSSSSSMALQKEISGGTAATAATTTTSSSSLLSSSNESLTTQDNESKKPSSTTATAATAPMQKEDASQKHQHHQGIPLARQWGKKKPPTPEIWAHRNTLHQWIACLRSNQQWERIQERCRSHPLEVMQEDRRGRTALHAACAKKPPVTVVAAMLEAAASTTMNAENNDKDREPKGTIDITTASSSMNAATVVSELLLLRRDKHGRTPLALALSSNASIETLEVLLGEGTATDETDETATTTFSFMTTLGFAGGDSDSDKEGDILHRFAAPVSPITTPAAVQDHLGNLPLHVCCAGYQMGTPAQVRLVERLLHVYPRGARLEAYNGRTALDAAVESQAPFEVIRLLVDAFPQGVVHDSCGLSPLFGAIQQHHQAPSSLNIISYMVQAHPAATTTRDRRGAYPLRRALEHKCNNLDILECLCPTSEVVLDADRIVQKTVLHVALEQQYDRRFVVMAASSFRAAQPPMRESVVRFLIEKAPSIGLAQNKAGQTPLGLACDAWLRLQHHHQQQQRQQQLNAADDDDATDDDDDDDDDSAVMPHVETPQTQYWWKLITLFLKGAHYGHKFRPHSKATSYHDESTPPRDGDHDHEKNKEPQRAFTLHAAVALQQSIPNAVLLHIMDVMGYQAALEDMHGQSALQLAITVPIVVGRANNMAPRSHLYTSPSPLTFTAETTTTLEEMLFRKQSVLLRILRLYPEGAAKTAETTSSLFNAGRLPLMLAALDGTISVEVLQELWSLYPAALHQVDPNFGLYPFQVAALQQQSEIARGTKQAPQMDTPSLNTPIHTHPTTAIFKIIEMKDNTDLQQKNKNHDDADLLENVRDLWQLSAVFGLLRQAPNLIALPPSKQENEKVLL